MAAESTNPMPRAYSGRAVGSAAASSPRDAVEIYESIAAWKPTATTVERQRSGEAMRI
jgi:hypothetical protein